VLGLAALFGALGLMHAGTWSATRPDARAWRVARALAGVSIVVLGLSGIVLFAPEARSIGANGAFLFKLGVIVAALINIAWFEWMARSPDSQRGGLRMAAALSVVLWLTVAAAGRVIAYW
jgi:hypothetical protein